MLRLLQYKGSPRTTQRAPSALSAQPLSVQHAASEARRAASPPASSEIQDLSVLPVLHARNMSTSAIKRVLDSPLSISLSEAKQLPKNRLNEQIKLLPVVRPFKNAKYHADFSVTKSIYVAHGNYAITNATDDNPILGSTNANFTIILALYDSKNKIAALAHIIPLNNLKSLLPMLDRMSRAHTVAHLVGGDKDELNRITEILQFIQSQKIPVLNVDVGRLAGGGSSALGINAKDGSVYPCLKGEEIGSYRDDRWGLSDEGCSLFKCYDGASSEPNLELQKYVEETYFTPMRRY